MAFDYKKFDWRSLQKYLDPQASKDLNVFLEHMPQRAGQTVLIAAGIAWASAAAVGLYTMVEVKNLTALRTQAQEAQALVPVVPQIKDVSIKAEDVKAFVESSEKVYPGLKISSNGAGLQIASSTTANFGEFREAVAHVQNGGSGWRVSLEKMCVGRECGQQKLDIILKINKVSVENPAAPAQ